MIIWFLWRIKSLYLDIKTKFVLAVYTYPRSMLMVKSYLYQNKVRRIACCVHHVNTFTKGTRVSFDRNKNAENV